MLAACPAPGPEVPLVHGLLGVVDCNVQLLAHSGYSALFEPSSLFAGVLTAVLTLYVALLGYRLMLGQTQLSVGEVAMTAVKIGAVLALATQWDTYQAVVYQTLFHGPQQLADAILRSMTPASATDHGDVFDRLQALIDALTTDAADYARHGAPQGSPLMGGAGFGAAALTGASTLLLLTSLGVLLAAKIVLGLLLAVGPLFIALMLFDSTRGLFEGWLRASLAFALAPMSATLLLGLALTMLEPVVDQLAGAEGQNDYGLGPVYGVIMLTLVFAGVTLGALIAGAMVAAGLKLPERKVAAASAPERTPLWTSERGEAGLSRAGRIAAAATALDRRDGARMMTEPAGGERSVRLTLDRGAVGADRAAPLSANEPRLGQIDRRARQTQTRRSDSRSAI